MQIQRSPFSRTNLIVPAVVAVLLIIISQSNLLLFHTLAELFAIIVAILVCVVAWNSYSYSKNSYLTFLAIGYFWVAILDLLHTLTFQGVAIILNADANSSIQYWIVARMLEALVLLTSPIFLRRTFNIWALFIVIGLISAAAHVSVQFELFPLAYIPGKGLTDFKIISEYLIIVLLCITIFLIHRNKKLIHPKIRQLMISSVALTIIGELCFTLYISVYSATLIAGHIIKFASFWLIYMAVVHTSLREPFRILSRVFSSYESIPIPTVVINTDGKILQVNQAAVLMAGVPLENLLNENVHRHFHPPQIAQERCILCKHIGEHRELRNIELGFGKGLNWREFTITPYKDFNQHHLLVEVSQDISVRKKAESELLKMAQFDTLTSLPNRILATDRLNQAIKSAKRQGVMAAVMFIDIDNFKNINDTQGHSVGDLLLKEVAKRLLLCVRDSDTVARWGGDEFIIVMPEVLQMEETEALSERILESLSKPFFITNNRYLVSVSIGIACVPNDGDIADILLSNADSAMYQAKEAGKNTYRFFEENLNKHAAERMKLIEQLLGALQNNEFSLQFQPIVDLIDDRIIGAEALIRWENKMLGTIEPDRFIPLAEESGLIETIGKWVLNTALSALKSLHEHDHRNIKLAVNISSKQLSNVGFVSYLSNLMDKYGIEHGKLELEITERLLLAHTEENLRILDELSQQGISISLDDFGTGYSSLSYLKTFPFTIVKIDQSFIRDITTNRNDAEICRAIVAMAKSLGLQTIAEGVETREQLEYLKGMGVDMAQGFYLGKPVSFQSFLQELQSKNK